MRGVALDFLSDKVDYSYERTLYRLREIFEMTKAFKENN